MGASLSTLGGWAIVLCLSGYYAFRYMDGNKKRELAKAAAHQKKRIEERYVPDKKENKNKAKRQRGESLVKEEKSDKAAKAKQRPATQQPLSTTTNQKAADYSSDDGADNREFAKQLAQLKQGTVFSGTTKKSDEKKPKYVKQSRAQEADNAPKPSKVSAPSSTTGADADDDQSSGASPDFTPVDSRDVSDMLEQPSSSGPSVLRLTDTDKTAKASNKKTKAPEVKETKKQRQNRAKAEAAKLAREAEEAERKVKAEQQRRTARIAEGRAAKDGSTFTNAAAPKNSAWTAPSNGVNGASTNGSSEFIPVQPLDTFDATSSKTDAAKASSPSVGKSSDNWVSSLPSEEEQLSLLQDEDNWNTVTNKKSKQSKPKKEAGTSDDNSNDQSSVTSSVHKPQKVTPVVQQPAIVSSKQPTPANGRPAGLGQQSSFAALSNDDDEQEQEWDV